jgi:hypothetical protein
MYGLTATDSLPADSIAGADDAVEESFFLALVISNGSARLLARFCEPAPTYVFRLNR